MLITEEVYSSSNVEDELKAINVMLLLTALLIFFISVYFYKL